MPLYMYMYIIFIDLTNAFDLVSRDGLFQDLKRIGCPERLLNVIISFHRDMKGVINFDGEISSPFPIDGGIHQGCILHQHSLAYSFLCSSDTLLKSAQNVYTCIQEAMALCSTLQRPRDVVLIKELLFADDASYT